MEELKLELYIQVLRVYGMIDTMKEEEITLDIMIMKLVL